MIFISPNFPTNYWQFCRELKNNGMNVLGIGDAPYDGLSDELRDSLSEYYKVDSLEPGPRCSRNRFSSASLDSLWVSEAPTPLSGFTTTGQPISEYYKVDSLEHYDAVYRAVAFFIHKHGRIDWLESNNEYWLERDAQLRREGVTSRSFPRYFMV